MDLWKFLLISFILFAGCISNDDVIPGNYSKVEVKPVNEMEYATFIYINVFRTHNGIDKVKLDPLLSEVARNYSRLMIRKNFFSHYYRGKDVKYRVNSTGYGFFSLGENLAELSGDCYDLELARKAVDLWSKSPAHRFVMENRIFDRVGIGVYCEGGLNAITTIYAQTCLNKTLHLVPDQILMVVPDSQPNSTRVLYIKTQGNCEYKQYVFPLEKQDSYFFYETPHEIIKKYKLPIGIALHSPFECSVTLEFCYLNDLE